MMRKLTTIDETLDRIYSFVDFSMTHVSDTDKSVFSLVKIRELLRRLGNPQSSFRSIHVAGTKGKGSVCAFLATGLRAAGYSVGLYTSPHLETFNERIQLNGSPINDDALIALTNRVLAVVDDSLRPSSFDLMTAIAFCYFAEAGVDFAVIETGLGGRLDSTNVVMPILTVITSISLDHISFLGDTIEAIAGEKAGILKTGVCCILAAENDRAGRTIRAVAESVGAPVISLRENYAFEGEAVPMERKIEGTVAPVAWTQTVTVRSLMGDGSDRFSFRIPLPGEHQVLNAAVACAALQQLEADGIIPSACAAVQGFEAVEWPCRFEVLRLSKGRTVVLDGAHNADSAQKLVATVRQYFADRRIAFVLGFSEDKNVADMIHQFGTVADVFIVTRSTHPRAAIPEKIAEVARETGKPVLMSDSLETAFEQIRRLDGIDVFVVTGSLFVAGGFRSLLRNAEAVEKCDTGTV